MKCKLPFSCEFGSFSQSEEVTDQRVITKYPQYFESASLPELETKPEPIALETKPKPKRTRKAKVE